MSEKKRFPLSLQGKKKLKFKYDDRVCIDRKFRDAQEAFRRPAFEGTVLEAERNAENYPESD